MRVLRSCGVWVMAWLVGALGVGHGAIPIQTNFIDGATAPEQWTTQQKSTFNAAMGYLGDQFVPTYEGQVWEVNAQLKDLGAPGTGDYYLAEAGPDQYEDRTLDGTTFSYAAALYNTLSGDDVLPGTVATITFNYQAPWNYSTTPEGLRPGDPSFYTTAVHEMTHGLGFLSALLPDGSWDDGTPLVYDAFLGMLTEGDQLTPLIDLSQAQRADAYTSNALFWLGEAATAGNPEGIPVQIYAPEPAEGGSSISHIDTEVSPDSLLMYPYALAGQTEPFTFSAMELGMLQDMGYVIVPEPGGGVLLVFGVTLLLARRRG